MIEITNALTKFKETIVERGHPPEIVWLHANQLFLNKNKLLNIYANYGFLHEQHVVHTYNKYKNDLECGAALMLVSTDANTSYCTFLVDAFGSDGDIELEEEHFYLWCDPYVKNFEFITSKYKWFLLKKFSKSNFQISSLDFAFTIKQAVI